MDPLTAVLIGLGLAGSAGLNAYVPFLVVGLLGRFDVLHLTSPYDGLSSLPVLAPMGLVVFVLVAALLARRWWRRRPRTSRGTAAV